MGIDPAKIRAARKAAHLSITEAAKRAGIGKSGWWEIEAGRTDPRASTVAAIAYVLSIPIGNLFKGSGAPTLSDAERRVIAAMRHQSN